MGVSELLRGSSGVRRGVTAMWVAFAAFLAFVVISSFDVGAERCEACVAEEDGRRACATAAASDVASATDAAVQVACDELHAGRAKTGGPRVRPRIDAAAACIEREPVSVSCEGSSR